MPRADVIDLSHYDDVTDGFAGTKAMGNLGVINKVTEGLGYSDPSFNWRRGPAERQGLLYGAYHFIRPGNPKSQVTYFLDRVGDPSGLRLCLDHEDPDVSVSTARAWLEEFYRKTDSWPTYYSYQDFIRQRASQMAQGVFKECPLWLAAYNRNPQWPHGIWEFVDLWQFTGDGLGSEPHQVPGIRIAGGCDINQANDRATLASSWATISGSSPHPQPTPIPDPPTPSPVDPSPILRIAERSAIARYRWAGRGEAPIGYTKGIAVTYARCLKNLRAGDSAATFMAEPNSHNASNDVLSWYAGVFSSKGMTNNNAGPDTLRHLFALMMGLGMRESSGIFTEGRDTSAGNTASDTAEAGLFQQSWGSIVSPLIPKLLRDYSVATVDGFIDIFKEGVTKPMSQDWGSGLGRTFQHLCKTKPAFAVEAAAIGLRSNRKEWGPINRYEAELVTSADVMLKEVEAVVT